MLLVVEQFLNGLQFGLLLFLLAAGLTLVFGIMDFVNLAHGSLYMMGAYFAATFVAWTGNFVTLRGVEHLASLVGTAYSRVIHDDSSFKLCLRGNLFVSHPKFADKVFCRLSEQFSFLRPTAGGWNGSYSPIVGAGLLAMSCTEPDEIDTIGATFLSSIANEPWARPTPSILPECN